ncbi:MAG: hypothetical protein NC131_13425 [Roseburia sp.]|nr:hypothetical protein [Roseburia sp.]
MSTEAIPARIAAIYKNLPQTMELPVNAIISLILCVVALVACFLPRVPAAIIAFIAMVYAYASGMGAIMSDMLVFWGVAAALVLGIRLLLGIDTNGGNAPRAYVAGGAAAGAFVGILVSPTSAGAILGSAAGAFLGSAAYMRTPASPQLGIASKPFVQFMAALGLPAVVTTSMVAITTVSILATMTLEAEL